MSPKSMKSKQNSKNYEVEFTVGSLVAINEYQLGFSFSRGVKCYNRINNRFEYDIFHDGVLCLVIANSLTMTKVLINGSIFWIDPLDLRHA